MKRNYSIIVLCCLLLAACSSGKKRLEKGDYDTAVFKAVNRLQQKPNLTKAEKVLRQAYTLAVNEHMEVIKYQDQTGGQFKYDHMTREYEMIDYLNKAIRRYPLYSDLVSLTDVTQELAFVRTEAAFAYKEEGDRLLKSGSKERARQAYFQFVEANKFVNGTVSLSKLDQAQEAGTMNVVVEFSGRKRFFRNFNTEQVFAGISNSLRNTRYRFLRIAEPGELDVEPDEIVQIEMDDANVGGVNFSERILSLKKDDVYMGEVKTDSGEVLKVYGTVTADYIEFCKTVNSNASIMLQVIDGNTSAVRHRSVLPSSYNWTQKWATYRGDQRALNDQQLKMARISEPRPPSPEWLFAQASGPLVGKSLNVIAHRYTYLK